MSNITYLPGKTGNPWDDDYHPLVKECLSKSDIERRVFLASAPKKPKVVLSKKDLKEVEMDAAKITEMTDETKLVEIGRLEKHMWKKYNLKAKRPPIRLARKMHLLRGGDGIIAYPTFTGLKLPWQYEDDDHTVNEWAPDSYEETHPHRRKLWGGCHAYSWDSDFSQPPQSWTDNSRNEGIRTYFAGIQKDFTDGHNRQLPAIRKYQEECDKIAIEAGIDISHR